MLPQVVTEHVLALQLQPPQEVPTAQFGPVLLTLTASETKPNFPPLSLTPDMDPHLSNFIPRSCQTRFPKRSWFCSLIPQQGRPRT